MLQAAKKTLNNADNFGQRETGNKKAGGAPSYSLAHQQRKAEGTAPAAPKTEAPKEFMGISTGQSSELNDALAAREAAKGEHQAQ
jgi:hypothetical protein